MCGSSGRGVEILKLSPTEAEAFFDGVIDKGPFIVEELIIQGKELAIFHPQSINTLRVQTFVIGTRVIIDHIILRMGLGNSVVDNFSAGGIFASVDVEHGIVQGRAINLLGDKFDFHPDTNVQIVGYQFPEWDKLLKLMTSMALKVEGATLVNWDVAYSNKGWIMVEGNEDAGFTGFQITEGKGLKPLLYSRMDEYFAYKQGLIGG